MENETATPPAPPKFSGLLQSLFADGTVQYAGEVGAPEQFPLTPAEWAEVRSVLPASPDLPPPAPEAGLGV